MTRARAARRLLAGWALSCTMLLAACAPQAVKPETTPTSTAQAAWQARRAALAQLAGFALQGRLAESGLISFGGNLSWIQSGENLEVRFYGPLGVGAVNISGTIAGVQIQTKDGSFQTDAPEALMQDKLGWSLPVAGLRYWVLGLPSPGSEPQALQLDGYGRLLAMQQDGWQLAYTEYQSVGGLDLPRKFSLASPDRGFRVVIDQWSQVQ